MAIRCLKCMKEHAEGVSKCPFCGYIEGQNEDEQCYLPPRTVLKGRYMIGCCLGSGGFGVTYVAWDSLLEKKVAIKEYLPSELATRTIGETRVTVHDNDCIEKYQQGKRSFLEESRRLARFTSVKGIVSIFDCFDENDTAYLVMECLEGKTLQQIINERKKIPFKEALPIFVDVLEALEVVHAAGMMHRDIAPDNIFVCNDGTAKLIDFGAARFMTTTHSRSLSMILKIGYAPIEQYTKHGNQGPWTDIYAVAASLYHAITGIVPPDSYDRVEEDKLRRPSLLARRLPKHAETAMLNALNIIETNRTPSAKQFAEELSGDLDVARIREKIKHEDTGRIAKWMKYAAAGVALAIVAFAVLYVSTGGALFRPSDYDVPVGMARVPYVVNDYVSDADVKLTENSLHMVIGDRITDAYFDNNFVLTQNPRSGNIAYTGSVVNVTASMKPDEYFIPNLSNFTQEYAVQVLEAAGFIVHIQEGKSDTAAPGAVIEQDPLGNTIVFEGSEVTIVINKASSNINTGKSIDAPDYVGMQFEKAQKNALDKGVYMAINRGEYSDTVPAGEILEQYPEAGGAAYDGSTVHVTVSLGKRTIIVPNLVYLSEEDACGKIEDRLLVPKIKYVENTSVQEGLVLEQIPASGVSIYENGEVTIFVSSGYKVGVPDVVGKTQEEAQNELANLRLGYAVIMENSETVPEGTVMAQDYAAGTSVTQGTIVTLTVSAGSSVIHVTGVSLNANAVTLEYGEIYTLVASVTPGNATSTAVTWSSSNSSVASVSSIGVINATGVGTATITVRTYDGDFIAQCTVTVVKVLTALDITSNPAKTGYYLNESADYSGLAVTATYSDGSKENVTNASTISGFDASSTGKKNITVQYTYEGVTLAKTFSIHVRTLTSIAVTSKPKEIYKINETESRDGLQVTAYYDDNASRVVTPASVSGFSSANSGVKTITVTYTEGYTPMQATYTITVQGDLVIEPASVTLNNGETYVLRAYYQNDSAEPEVVWTSDNPAAVSVSSNGTTCTITALEAGMVKISAVDQYNVPAQASVLAHGPILTVYNERPDESQYEILDSWTEYRTQTRTKTMSMDWKDSSDSTMSLDGWTLYHTDNFSSWVKNGGEQGPVDWNPGNSDARKTTRTESVKVSDAWTEIITPERKVHTGYSYFRYYRDDSKYPYKSANSCCSTNIDYYSEPQSKTTGISDKLIKTSKVISCTCHGSFAVYTTTGVASNNVAWWFGESEVYETYPAETITHPAVYKTVYYYQDYRWNSSYRHYFYKWNGWGGWSTWSDWSKNAATAGTTTSGSVPNQTQTETAVETRTVYSYRVRVQ